MKLLICTQAVDREDPILGFFHRWIEEFAKHCDQVSIICLREGAHALPPNVRVYSLGKERGRMFRIQYALRFYRHLWRLRNSYDSVFVHMNPEYVVLGGIWWRLTGVRIALWYMHKSVTVRLRLAVFWSHVVFTASPRSMRIRTLKKRVVGHGIPLDSFDPVSPPAEERPLSLITVGRISKVKRLELLIDMIALLVEQGLDTVLTIVGEASSVEDKFYAESLKSRASHLGIFGRVHFAGAVQQSKLQDLFAKHHLFLHASDTGSLDKAVLEALAAGLPVVTVDAELARENVPAIFFAQPQAASFAEAIKRAVAQKVWSDTQARVAARSFIASRHSLPQLIKRMLGTDGWALNLDTPGS